jgi:hypothetical protein
MFKLLRFKPKENHTMQRTQPRSWRHFIALRLGACLLSLAGLTLQTAAFAQQGRTRQCDDLLRGGGLKLEQSISQ